MLTGLKKDFCCCCYHVRLEISQRTLFVLLCVNCLSDHPPRIHDNGPNKQKAPSKSIILEPSGMP